MFSNTLRKSSSTLVALVVMFGMTTVEFFNKLLRSRSRTGVSASHCFTAELSTPCCFSLNCNKDQTKI